MLDIGWSELILIGVVALIVIGPKDLPDMFRQLGRFTAKLRTMARDFSRAMEQAASDSGVKDVAKDLKSMTSPQSLGLNAMKDAASKFERWDPLKNAANPTKPAVTAAAAAAVPIGPETQALLDKQLARQAIVQESTQRLRALQDPAPAAPAADVPQPPVDGAALQPPVVAAKPRARAVRPPPAPAAEMVEKPKAKRKPKKADEA